MAAGQVEGEPVAARLAGPARASSSLRPVPRRSRRPDRAFGSSSSRARALRSPRVRRDRGPPRRSGVSVARHGRVPSLAVASPVIGRTFRVEGPLDLRRTLGVLSRGPGDRTFRVATGRAWYATRTVDGAATVALVHVGDEVRAEG